jgi:hypothetical protein
MERMRKEKMVQKAQEKEALSSASYCFKDNRAKLDLLNARFSITPPAYENFGLGCSCKTSRQYT